MDHYIFLFAFPIFTVALHCQPSDIKKTKCYYVLSEVMAHMQCYTVTLLTLSKKKPDLFFIL